MKAEIFVGWRSFMTVKWYQGEEYFVIKLAYYDYKSWVARSNEYHTYSVWFYKSSPCCTNRLFGSYELTAIQMRGKRISSYHLCAAELWWYQMLVLAVCLHKIYREIIGHFSFGLLVLMSLSSFLLETQKEFAQISCSQKGI